MEDPAAHSRYLCSLTFGGRAEAVIIQSRLPPSGETGDQLRARATARLFEPDGVGQPLTVGLDEGGERAAVLHLDLGGLLAVGLAHLGGGVEGGDGAVRCLA